MTTDEIMERLDDLLGKHDGSELELMEALCDRATGWRMRLEELQDEESDDA
jgi:hypothetical protein